MPVAVKICGLNSPEAVKAAVDNGASYAGFIFYPKSPRNVSLELAKELGTLDLKEAKKVAVTVNATDTELADIIDALNPDLLQLHGDETIERAREIRTKFCRPIIKAIKIDRTKTPFESEIIIAQKFAKVADILLFDSKDVYSQSDLEVGKPFAWRLLMNQDFSIRYMLSGGLNYDNIEIALKITGAKIVDLSSGLETSPGKKSPELIEKFMRKIREL